MTKYLPMAFGCGDAGCLRSSVLHTVLAVKDERAEALAACGGLRSLTAALRCALALSQAIRLSQASEIVIMKSYLGRPRALTDVQVQALLEWNRTRKSLRDFSREYGVSVSTLENAIARNGQYKQPSPELRALALAESRERRRRLREAGWI